MTLVPGHKVGARHGSYRLLLKSGRHGGGGGGGDGSNCSFDVFSTMFSLEGGGLSEDQDDEVEEQKGGDLEDQLETAAICLRWIGFQS